MAHSHLSSQLQAFLDQLEGNDTTFGQLATLIGDRGFGMLLVLLSLPAALPVPAVGYGTPFGILMAILGFQIATGNTAPWIPKYFEDRRVPYSLLSFAVRNGRFPLRVVELLIRPRLPILANHRYLLPAVGIIIMCLAGLMSLPIPLTNTAPSFVVFLLAAGLLEEDGLFLCCGICLAPIAMVIAGTAAYFAVTLGPDAVEATVMPFLRGIVGL